MFFYSHLSASPVFVDMQAHSIQRRAVLGRIAEKLNADHTLRESILKTGIMPVQYDHTYELPMGYVYELDVQYDFPDLLAALRCDGIWMSVSSCEMPSNKLLSKHQRSLKGSLACLHACMELAILSHNQSL